MRSGLTEAQRNKACFLFYCEGMTLRMVADELGCGLYDLTPWLTAPAARIAASAITEDRERQRTLAAQPGGSADGR